MRMMHQGNDIRPTAFDRITTLREMLGIAFADMTWRIRGQLIVVTLLVIGTSTMAAAGPVVLKLLIDGFSGKASRVQIPAAALIGVYVFSQWLSRAVGELRGWLHARVERRMFRSLSERLFSHLIRLPMRFHIERQTGAIHQTLDNGLQGCQSILYHSLFTCLPILGELAAIVVILWRFVPGVILIMFGTALVFFASSARKIAGVTETAAAAHVDASGAMMDGLLNYEIVKCFTAELQMQARVHAALSRTESEWLKFHRRHAVNGLVTATILAALLAAVLEYSRRELAEGAMSVGDFVLVSTYLMQFVRPLETLGNTLQGMSQAFGLLRKMLPLFRQEPEQQQQTIEQEQPSGPATLEFEEVQASYHPHRSVLHNVSFKVPAGKTIGIVGHSGSGKSTLVRLLVRLLEPDAGRILLDGVPIAQLSLRALRSAVAVVPQETILLNESIGSNIAFGKLHCSKAEIERAAKLTQLHDLIVSLPAGYNTRVRERGAKLSGGERQRLSLARAVIKKPRIYVFDEATSSLDSITEQEILRNLREISRGCTTLLIAHRLSTIVHADEIVVVDGGEIRERGTHDSLLRSCGVYSTLWNAHRYGFIAA
jgi:ABC-type transport system involved in Fe-S cluster assembly fused permease/ATPase subunit